MGRLGAADRQQLRAQLVDHEALRLTPYRCTSGKLTVLVGFNVDDRGLPALSKALGRPVASLVKERFTEADAMRVLDADIDRIEADVAGRWRNYESIDSVRQRAVIDFVFNLGLAGAAQFANAIRFADMALSTPDVGFQEACWTAVAYHAMDSVWARQVDDGLAGRRGRADRLATMIRKGTDPGPMK